MTQEVGPQLDRPDWPAYRDALLARFTNPALQHSVHQIATDSSQKIPQRWPPSVLGALRAGLPVDCLAFAAAAWMRYLRGSDEQGQAYAMNDPMVGECRPWHARMTAMPQPVCRPWARCRRSGARSYRRMCAGCRSSPAAWTDRMSGSAGCAGEVADRAGRRIKPFSGIYEKNRPPALVGRSQSAPVLIAQ